MILGCKSRESKCAERLSGFAAAVQATIDPTELQAWAVAILQRYAPGEELHDVIPHSVQTFDNNAPRVSVSRLDQPKEKIIEIWWRTDYGRKGIMIGPQTSQLMASTEPCKREWKPGIVLFCQAD
jgi:hypothetical protein